MRSFLIRDILSSSESAANNQEQTNSSSNFVESLAATQARFLAKWAEHQHQIQASKYLEHLQAQSSHLANIHQQHLTLAAHHHLQTRANSHLHTPNASRDDEEVEVVAEDDDDEDDDHFEERADDIEAQVEDEDDDDLDDRHELNETDHLEDVTAEGNRSTARVRASHQHNRCTPGKPLAGSSRATHSPIEPLQLTNSPLDALFQMTSSTFDALKKGEKRKDRETEHCSNFTSKQTSKKKRKSRTAFTNNQIYELERRFRIQKYLSPTDRDEIALTLNLSNAQVITWFQNRRAKLKRDLEEQKRDIETASLLNLHKTFLESFQALSQMKTAIKPTDQICRSGGLVTNMNEDQDMNRIN